MISASLRESKTARFLDIDQGSESVTCLEGQDLYVWTAAKGTAAIPDRAVQFKGRRYQNDCYIKLCVMSTTKGYCPV